METFRNGNTKEQIANLLTRAASNILEPVSDGIESARMTEKALALMKQIVDSRAGKSVRFPV